MKIIWYIVAVFLLVFAAYIVDLLLTSGNLISNLLTMYGVTGSSLVEPVDPVILTIISFSVVVLIVAALLHIAKSIRRREA